MGELIRREVTSNPLAFSGERMTSDISGQIEVEHSHRYLLARDFCRGRDVLDVAAGEGYGTALLSQVARSATGVEIDESSVLVARREFSRSNLTFMQGDACALQLSDASFDVVVSFETLEHLSDQTKFLSEITRVLRPGGLFIVSTPDRNVYSPVGHEPNPFHAHELTRFEFSKVLFDRFEYVEIFAQRPIIGSAILGDRSICAPRVFERRGSDYVEGNDDLPRAPYLVGFASNAVLPTLPNSLYLHRSDLDTDPQERDSAERRALSLSEDVSELRRQLAEANAAIGDAEAARQRAEASRHEWDAERLALAEELEAAVRRYSQLEAVRDAILLDANDHKTTAKRLEHNLVLRDQELRHARLEAQRAGASLAALQPRLGRAEERARKAEARMQGAADDAARADAAAALALQQAQQAHQREDEAHRDADLHRRQADLLSEEAVALRARVYALEFSTTWRVGAPLRRFSGRFPSMARFVRRGAKVTWWGVTGKLPQRLRARRRLMLASMSVEQTAAPSPAFLPPSADAAWHEAADHSVQAERSALGDIVEKCLIDNSGAVALSPTMIRISASARPVVSIIIPTYGQVAFTLRCLTSISVHMPHVPIEVIVMDDAYPGEDRLRLADEVEGIRLLRNPENIGFLYSCNRAAKHAVGDYLFFLNNDTEICPESLDALAGVLDTQPDVGMAGSKLLFPTGRLQEAGGVVWVDGSAWNWGRNDDPDRPEYNYRREVDYISGAAIMIRRSLFEELGGFDPEFAPAYYEDTDIAFRIRAHGLKVVYEPRSVVIHHEGVSHGTDATSGGKAYQVRNAERMLNRWREVLSRDHFPNGCNVLRARDRARHRTTILIVDHYVPEPDHDAGSRTMMGVVTSLLDAGWLIKFWPQNRLHSEIYTPVLEDMGIEVLDNRWPGDIRAWLDQNGEDLDHVLVSRPSVAVDLLMHIVVRTPAKLSFYGHDLHFARLAREAAFTGDAGKAREAAAMEWFERRIWRQFDTVIYLSEDEAQTVRSMVPGINCHSVVPYCFESFEMREQVARSADILFVAGFAHPPNVHAAEFLVREVLPLVHAQMPEARLVLAGSHPSLAVRALAGDAVEVTGWVSDEKLALLYQASRVAVVPLQFGAGVKGKVVEALRFGLPLVTTTTGSQGLPGLDAVVPVFDDPAEIAREILALLRDDARWMAQAQAQVRYAEAHFSRGAMRESLLRALVEPSGAAAAPRAGFDAVLGEG
jgi:GT2 family glycosyltransferase/SAM-dependent methyltransferase